MEIPLYVTFFKRSQVRLFGKTVKTFVYCQMYMTTEGLRNLHRSALTPFPAHYNYSLLISFTNLYHIAIYFKLTPSSTYFFVLLVEPPQTFIFS